jgi:hypothetical protein
MNAEARALAAIRKVRDNTGWADQHALCDAARELLWDDEPARKAIPKVWIARFAIAPPN